MSDEISPVRRQYLEIKRQHPTAIVFFRLGDFYETFDTDAETAARELDIVLTSRNVAKGDANTFLAAALVEDGELGLAFADVSTGEFFATQTQSPDPEQVLRQELARITPAEVLLDEEGNLNGDWLGHVTRLPSWRFE